MSIFVDLANRIGQVGYRVGSDLIMNEGLGGWIESIETVFATHPQCSRAVLEQRQHEHPAQTIGLARIILEHPELVSVVAIDSLLSRKPHESLIILDDLRDAVLR